MKYIFVYQTKCLVNNKTYIGVHKTNNLDDGYLGCGCYSRRPSSWRYKGGITGAIKKYGPHHFFMQPMAFFDTVEQAYDEERYLVTDDVVKDKSNYNMARGGFGGFISDEAVEKIRIARAKQDMTTHRKPQLDTLTGIIYDSKKSAVQALGLYQKAYQKKWFIKRFKDAI